MHAPPDSFFVDSDLDGLLCVRCGVQLRFGDLARLAVVRVETTEEGALSLQTVVVHQWCELPGGEVTRH